MSAAIWYMEQMDEDLAEAAKGKTSREILSAIGDIERISLHWRTNAELRIRRDILSDELRRRGKTTA